MKAYLITTGALFALLTVLHLARIVAEWGRAGADRGFVFQMAVLSVLTTALAVWAWRLLRRLRAE